MLYQHNLVKSNESGYVSLHRQQGVVIVIALFIVALAAAMAYTVMSRLARDTERTSQILHNIQAEFYAEGAVAWAMDTLIQDWEKQQPNQPIDMMPIQSPLDVINGYQIISSIDDIQSRFNINNIINMDAQNDFQRLLGVVVPDLTQERAVNITRAMTDWVSPNYTQQNELTQYYLDLTIPYRPAHRAMMSISELRLVKGISPQLFVKLEPYLTALPMGVQTNIQFAKAPVLMTLSKSMTLSAAKTLEEWFAKTKIFSKETMLGLEVFKNNQISPNKIVLVSQFFLLKTEVVIEKQRLVLYTLLERVVNERKAIVRIVWQSKNLPS